jgi:hypothetical protein
MRCVFLVVASSFVLAAPALAQGEIVTGFRGYPWGTPVAAIPEIAGTEQVGVKEGLHIYSAQVTVSGKPGLAGFYFHPQTGGLVEGAYVFALTLQDCHGVWANVVEDIEARFTGLVREAEIPSRTLEERAIYDTDCEYYAYNAHRENWRATYRNPSPPDDRIELWMRTVERAPRLTVLFRGGAGQAWFDARPRPPGNQPD